MPWVPLAASATLRFISLVVAVCSSTAAAMVAWKSLISPMTELIRLIASTAPAVSAWMASTRVEMSSVARAVSCASSLTSLATTAKPLPASPARAASMVALSASRFVCSAIEVITFTTLPISAEDSPSLAIVADVDAAASTALVATWLASSAFDAISRIEAPICSAPAATVCTLRLTSSAAPETTPACAEVSSAPAEICDEDADSSSELAATASADDATVPSTDRRLATAPSSAAPIRPSSSRVVRPLLRVRSPFARASAGAPSRAPGREAPGEPLHPADTARHPDGHDEADAHRRGDADDQDDDRGGPLVLFRALRPGCGVLRQALLEGLHLVQGGHGRETQRVALLAGDGPPTVVVARFGQGPQVGVHHLDERIEVPAGLLVERLRLRARESFQVDVVGGVVLVPQICDRVEDLGGLLGVGLEQGVARRDADIGDQRPHVGCGRQPVDVLGVQHPARVGRRAQGGDPHDADEHGDERGDRHGREHLRLDPTVTPPGPQGRGTDPLGSDRASVPR